jgi:hypothetical protein
VTYVEFIHREQSLNKWPFLGHVDPLAPVDNLGVTHLVKPTMLTLFDSQNNSEKGESRLFSISTYQTRCVVRARDSSLSDLTHPHAW